MKIYALIQARMNSERFPGKVLHKVKGKPLISFMLERIKRCQGLEGLIVATSVDKSDDPLYQYCSSHGIRCCRGSLKNVPKRFKDIIQTNNIKVFVRLSGDSPLIDPAIVEKGISLFRENNYDIVTNVFHRSYPKGQSVEVLRSSIFLEAYQEIEKLPYNEHVTKYFYENKTKYRIYNFTSGMEAGDIQLSVDTADDMKLFEEIVKKIERPHWQYTWQEILELRKNILGK